jgi:branched-chain amino acid transport system permease protein
MGCSVRAASGRFDVKHLLGCRSLLVLLFACLGLIPIGANPYSLFVGNLILIYIILAIGLNLLIGFAGHLAFANAAMFGIGAYGAGLIQVDLGLPFWLALPGGALLAMVLGTTMALPALRLSGIYLAMATLGFAQFTQWVFLNWETVTYGAGGFRVPRVDFSPLPIRSEYGVYYLSWIITLGLVLFAWNAMRSRVGRAFVAMRDGEIAAESLGVNLLRYKALAFALSGIYAGIAGALYTAMLNYVAPEGFDLFQMVIQKAMVMVGGIGSIIGSVIGATLLVVLLEALRAFKSTQEIAFGSILLLFVVFFPGGLVSLCRRYLPGWEEPLHIPGVMARPTAVDSIASSTTSSASLAKADR